MIGKVSELQSAHATAHNLQILLLCLTGALTVQVRCFRKFCQRIGDKVETKVKVEV